MEKGFSKGAVCFLCIFLVITAALMWSICIQAANTVQYTIWNSPAVTFAMKQDQKVITGELLKEQEEE